MRPIVWLAVIDRRNFVPVRRRLPVRPRESVIGRVELTVRRLVANGHDLLSQPNVIFAPRGRLCRISARRSVKFRPTAQRFETTAGRRSHGLATRSQFSSTLLPRISTALGLIFGSLSLQSAGAREAVAVDVEVHVVGEPVAVLVDPIGQDLARTREDRRDWASSQSIPDAKLSASPSMPVSQSAMTSVKSLRDGGQLPSPQEIRSALPSSAWIVSLPLAAGVVVQAAEASEGVVAEAARQDVGTRAAVERVVVVPARDGEGHGDA